MRRTALLLAVMAAALVVASGMALAKTFVGTENGEKIVGTKLGDHINGLGGDDVLLEGVMNSDPEAVACGHGNSKTIPK